jgi:hypothetical protein
MFVAALLSGYFGMTDSLTINLAVLAACIIFVCGTFILKNERYFSAKEKTAVIFWLIIIDLLLQTILATVGLYNSPSGFQTRALFYAVGIIGSLHAIAIFIFVTVTKRLFIRRGTIND